MPATAIGAAILPSGRTEFGPFNVAPNLTTVAIEIDSTQHLNPGVMVSIGLEISYDNGATWVSFGMATRPGGVAFGDGGVVVTTLDLSTAMEQPGNNQRRIRGFIENGGGSFTTSGGQIRVE